MNKKIKDSENKSPLQTSKAETNSAEVPAVIEKKDNKRHTKTAKSSTAHSLEVVQVDSHENVPAVQTTAEQKDPKTETVSPQTKHSATEEPSLKEDIKTKASENLPPMEEASEAEKEALKVEQEISQEALVNKQLEQLWANGRKQLLNQSMLHNNSLNSSQSTSQSANKPVR